MGMFLDSKTPAEEYRRISQSRFFVDKTLIIKEAMASTTGDLPKKKLVLKKLYGRSKALMITVFSTLNSTPYRIRTILAISMQQAMRLQTATRVWQHGLTVTNNTWKKISAFLSGILLMFSFLLTMKVLHMATHQLTIGHVISCLLTSKMKFMNA